MKKVIIILFLIIIQKSNCQIVEKDSVLDVGITDSEFSEFQVTFYKPDSNVYGDVKTISESNRNTPEETFNSIWSENSLEWYNLNHVDKEGQDSDIAKYYNSSSFLNYDRTSNYAILLLKYSFTYKDTKYSMIKYCFHNNKSDDLGKDYPLLMDLFQKQSNGEWLSTACCVDSKLYKYLLNCLVLLKSSFVLSLINNGTNVLHNDVKQKVIINNKISLDLLYKEVSNLQNSNNISLKESILDKPNW